MNTRLSILFSLACMGLAGNAGASDGTSPDDIPRALMKNITFLHGHPDVQWRIEGSRQLHRGDTAGAMESFTRAARFADKPSQAAIAELLWEGRGTAQNRALAYSWMDLAAERGYQSFLLKREAMWRDLDEQEREQALAVGAQLYADYGDDVAKPRTYAVMRREKSRHVGSRVGADVSRRFTGSLPAARMSGTLTESSLVSADGMEPASTEFYKDRFWHPESWWNNQDRQWQGEVIVHPLRDDDSDQP